MTRLARCIWSAMLTLCGASFGPSARAQQVLYEVAGDASGDVLGFAVSAAHDLDGDAVGDFLVGMPGWHVSAWGCGGVRAYSGADGSVLFSVFGEVPNGFLGHALAALGDVNGDGASDVAAGADNTALDGNEGVGLVRVCSGRDGSLLYALDGRPLGGHFGAALDGVGDVNLDGFPDLAVGAPTASPGVSAAGRVAVFSGTDGALLLDLPGTDGAQHLGRSVTHAGDLDHDGFPEIAAGAPGFSDELSARGRVLIFSGADGRVLHEMLGRHDLASLGAAVECAGDVDQDGTPDLAAGAPYDQLDGMVDPHHGTPRPHPVSGGQRTGVVAVFSGATGRQLSLAGGQRNGEEFGSTLAAMPDLDRDGRPDLIVGAPRASRVDLVSAVDGRLLRAIHGARADERFGCAVAAIADVNGSGFDELLVGALFGDGDVADTGLARVIEGDLGL